MTPKPATAERWVHIDVLATALGVSENRARRIALAEGIRSRGDRPRTYAYTDIVRVHRARKASR